MGESKEMNLNLLFPWVLASSRRGNWEAEKDFWALNWLRKKKRVQANQVWERGAGNAHTWGWDPEGCIQTTGWSGNKIILVEMQSRLKHSVCLIAQSCLTLCAPWTVAHRLLCPWRFSRQGYWTGLPCPPPGDFPNPGIEPRSPTLQENSLPSEPPGKH